MVLEFNAGADVFRRVAAAVEAETDGRAGPEGSLFHAAGRSAAGGWCMVEVWVSQDALLQWQQTGLAAALRRAGVSPPAPARVTMFEVEQLDIASR